MAIMKCPRCGGGGYIYESWRQGTAAGQQQSLCPSCSGRGYVTDGANEKEDKTNLIELND